MPGGTRPALGLFSEADVDTSRYSTTPTATARPDRSPRRPLGGIEAQAVASGIPIHPNAWKGNSANFVWRGSTKFASGFSECHYNRGGRRQPQLPS